MAGGIVRVGISGWRYPSWRGVFYPPGLPQRQELRYASQRLRTIEINGSFYSLQRPSSWTRWFDDTPDDFVFAVKGGRFLTHLKKLLDCEVPLANFFAQGVLALGRKLGPILWQLPPQLPFDGARLGRFLAMLPRTTAAAERVAAGHDGRVSRPPVIARQADRPLRHALEVRHESCRSGVCFDLLRRHGVALCVSDTAGRYPAIDEATADFVYVRLHGATRLYVSGYGRVALENRGCAARGP